jgi:membrane-associated phospholipid phosphatase
VRRRVDAESLVQRAKLAWQTPRQRKRLELVAFLLVSLTAFGHIVEDFLTGDPIVRWDVSFAAWLHEHSSEHLVTVFKVATHAGGFAVLVPLTTAVVLVLHRRGARGDAALVACVMIGITLLNAGLKLAFHRPRPELGFLHLDTYSFPSGHAAASTAAYGVFAYLLGRNASRGRRIALGVAVVLIVAVVDFSRLYLGVHYLSDVLAGSALGASWLAFCLLVQHELRR